MTRETSAEVASIAGHFFNMDDDQIRAAVAASGPSTDRGSFLSMLRSVIGSALSQRQDEPAPATPAWHDFPESSHVKRMRFDPAASALDVEFRGGSTYRYQEVPADVAAQLQIAESPGRFLNERVKDAYLFTKINEHGTPVTSPGRVPTQDGYISPRDREDAAQAKGEGNGNS